MQSIAVTSANAGTYNANPAAPSSASLVDTFAVFLKVLFPTLAKGVIMRRPSVLRVAERMDFDRRAVSELQRIRRNYGDRPLLLPIPKRPIVLILNPEDVHRVLNQSPDVFEVATKEKRAALAHFEPKGVLVSKGIERLERRQFNEQVLDAHQQVHQLASSFLQVINEEVSRMSRLLLQQRSELNWDAFSDAWFRIVRRVVFGNAAADDNRLSKVMAQLRSAANWAFLAPQRRGLRNQLLSRIEHYLKQADPGCLAAVMARTHTTAITEPSQQVPQWLFAFDAAGMTAYRTLALLASHREYAAHVRAEISQGAGSPRYLLPRTRAAVLEALRLWPTTPLLLRETKTETACDGTAFPPNADIVIFTPFFHRDNERLPYADRFTPELWNGPDQPRDWPLFPFSEGPAMCPGRHLVLLLVPALIAAILDNLRLKLNTDLLNANRPLPGTLNHFGLTFEIRPGIT